MNPLLNKGNHFHLHHCSQGQGSNLVNKGIQGTNWEDKMYNENY